MTERAPRTDAEAALVDHVEWVRQLARELCRDVHRADDVEQATWLVALERAPTDLRRPAAWLAAVVRRTAQHLRRGEGRRTARESAAPPPADVPSPDELVEQADALRRVLTAVARLEEPYRSTILLHYYRDRTPSEIARSLGIPAATVRSRLKRALGLLRGSLEDEFGADSSSHREFLACLAAAGSLGAPNAAAVFGAITMGTNAKLAVAATLLVAFGLTWSSWSGDRDETRTSNAPNPPDESPAGAAPNTAEAAEVAERVAVLPLDPDPAASASTSAPAPAEAELFGAILDASTEGPVADAEVRLGHRSVRTDSSGSFRFDAVLRGHDASLRVRGHGYLETFRTVAVEDSPWTRCDVRIEPGSPVPLRVVDRRTEAPIPGARVLPFESWDEIAITDEDGRAEVFARIGTRLALRVEAEGFAPIQWFHELLEFGIEPTLPLEAWAFLDGTVSAERETELEELAFEVTNPGCSGGRSPIPAALLDQYGLPGIAYHECRGRPVRIDPRGNFELAVLPLDTDYVLEARASPDLRARVASLALRTAGERRTLRLVLRAGASVHGTVLRNDRPWPGNVVWWDRDGTERGRTRVQADGSYELRGVDPGTVEVGLDPLPTVAGAGSRRRLDVEPGAARRQDFAWQEHRSTIRGRVTTADGSPAPRIDVYAERLDSQDGPRTGSARTQEDGAYELDVESGGRYSVFLPRGAVLLREAAAAGATDVDFVLPRLGTLALRLVDAETREGLALEHLRQDAISFRCRGEESFQAVPAKDRGPGLFELELPVGTGDLLVALGEHGFARELLEGVVVSERAGDEPLDLLLPRGGELRLHVDPVPDRSGLEWSGTVVLALREPERNSVRGPFEHPGPPANFDVDGVRLWLRDPALIRARVVVDERGNARLTGLAPGHYTLHAFPDQLEFTPASFWVEPGESVPQDVTWRRR